MTASTTSIVFTDGITGDDKDVAHRDRLKSMAAMNQGAKMKTPQRQWIQTTLGDLIAILCEATENLEWLGKNERQLVVAFILNDLVKRAKIQVSSKVSEL